MNQHICSNCATSFPGNYCNHCGQKLAHRITLTHIAHELVHVFTHADKGFLYLFLRMFVKPGIVGREYIVEGKRQRYFSPFQYIIIIGSIAAFVAVNSHFMQTTIAAIGANNYYSARQSVFLGKLSGYQNKYYNFIILLQLPFYALGTYIVFRKYKFNYAEHLILQTFITAQTTIMAMLVMITIGILGKSGIYLASIMGIVSTIFQVIAYRQFFREKYVVGFLKGLVANLVGVVLFFIFMMIVIGIYGVVTHAF